MNETYLVHHGILGQKWGKKNGPPYPLDFSKLSSEEREKAKKESIEKGDIRTANANRNYYSNQDINELINRFDLNQRLSQKVSSLDKEQIESGLKRIEKVTNGVRTVSNLVGTVGDATNNFNKMKKAFNEAMGITSTDDDKKKSTFSFDSKKIKDMMANPDKYSDEEWQAAKNRMQSINQFEQTKKMQDDRNASTKEMKMDKSIEKIIKDIDESNKKWSKKSSKSEGPLTGTVEGTGTSSSKKNNKNNKKSFNEDPIDVGWRYVDALLALEDKQRR